MFRIKYERSETKLSTTEKEKKTLEKKYENTVVKATKLVTELKDEKQMNEFLRENQVYFCLCLYSHHTVHG